MSKDNQSNDCEMNPQFQDPSVKNKESKPLPISSSVQTNYCTPKKLAPSTDYCRVKHHNPKINSSKHYFLHSQLLQFSELPPIVRERMIVWVNDQGAKRFLLRETCTLAVILMDLYFVRNGDVMVKNVQELGIACLNLALKFNQSSTRPIQINTEVFSVQSVNNFQRQVLIKSNFRLNPPNYSRIATNLLLKISQKISKPDTPYKKLKSLLFFKSLQNLHNHNHNSNSNSNYPLHFSRVLEFFQLLDCSIAVKEMLEYDVEDFVYNAFVVFVKSYESAQRNRLISFQHEDKENSQYELQKFLNEIFLQTEHHLGNPNSEPPSICFDSPIQSLIQITQTTLQKHRQLNLLILPPLTTLPTLPTLKSLFPTFTISQLLQIQTYQPYQLKVIKQSSSKISHHQSLFQI